MSRQLLKEKMQTIALTDAEAVVAPNPGCMLQLRYGVQQYGPSAEVYHLMDLLERSYSAAEVSSSK
jgi:glycolate oxidase iron-sulfur subunit